MLKLYSYFRSSASYRVRIGLAIKGLPYETAGVNLLTKANQDAKFRAVNPAQKVPFLTEGLAGISQSLAILEYLEETHPSPPLLPNSPLARARVRAIANHIACDIHPLNNLAPLNFLRQQLHADDLLVTKWYHHWIIEGFNALESMLEDKRTGRFCHGNSVTLADICLVPQVANARRFDVPMHAWPIISRIDAECQRHPAFIAAHPDKQPDAPANQR